eukprot:6174150-Pleurochrysis_carterae.AAC.2
MASASSLGWGAPPFRAIRQFSDDTDKLASSSVRPNSSVKRWPRPSIRYRYARWDSYMEDSSRFSSTVTFQPRSARTMATASPAGPAPTTTAKGGEELSTGTAASASSCGALDLLTVWWPRRRLYGGPAMPVVILPDVPNSTARVVKLIIAKPPATTAAIAVDMALQSPPSRRDPGRWWCRSAVQCAVQRDDRADATALKQSRNPMHISKLQVSLEKIVRPKTRVLCNTRLPNPCHLKT